MAKFKKTAKQKNKKKENKQLPSNYRTIPEKLNSDKLIFLVGFASVFGAVILISLNVYLAFERQKSLINERFELVKELSFWFIPYTATLLKVTFPLPVGTFLPAKFA